MQASAHSKNVKSNRTGAARNEGIFDWHPKKALASGSVGKYRECVSSENAPQSHPPRKINVG